MSSQASRAKSIILFLRHSTKEHTTHMFCQKDSIESDHKKCTPRPLTEEEMKEILATMKDEEAKEKPINIMVLYKFGYFCALEHNLEAFRNILRMSKIGSPENRLLIKGYYRCLAIHQADADRFSFNMMMTKKLDQTSEDYKALIRIAFAFLGKKFTYRSVGDYTMPEFDLHLKSSVEILTLDDVDFVNKVKCVFIDLVPKTEEEWRERYSSSDSVNESSDDENTLLLWGPKKKEY